MNAVLAMVMPTKDVSAALANWARWCRAVGECYPACAANWDMFEQIEYKNCHQTIEEKLQEAIDHREPDELEAMQVERIVNGLNVARRTAIRVHFVVMPDIGRHDKGLTMDQWDERRARFATRRSGWYFSPSMYHDAVREAIDAVEVAL